MKRTVKKIAAVGLALTTVMGLVACGSPGTETKTTKVAATKPDTFKVMVDNTVVTEANGGIEFAKYMNGLTGIDIKWVRPDHTTYYDAVGIAFNADDTTPDVILLSSDYYASFAAQGLLWNMTDAWAASDTKASGRLISTADNVLKALNVVGGDGKLAMYGFSPYRGNGCCTYIKEAWLTKAGYKASDVKGKTLTFAEYYAILKKMKAAYPDNAVLSAPGFIANEAPYTNYLPEFYQQANFTFYKDSTGKYVDGFSATAMKDALTRIALGVKDGIIDKESVNNSTANCRDKFYADKTGVFTYWAGTWAETLVANLKTKGFDSSLIAINPIKELGTYVERIAPAWCITTNAANPEGIFKYFIDTMLDGGDVQLAWTYGAKGTHWDTKAESVTLQGKESSPTVYTEGQFHMLPSPEKPSVMMQKNHIDPILSLAKFTAGDPGASSLTAIAVENGEFFAANSAVAIPVPQTEEMGDNIADINIQRKNIVAKVASGELTAEQGMTEYNKNVGTLVTEVLESLNKLK